MRGALAERGGGAVRGARAREEAVSAGDLRELMEAVCHTTARLEQTHGALQAEVKRLQGELAEANAALGRSRTLAELGQMAAGIAHEIRNPLASIELYVQLLREEARGRVVETELCGKIQVAVRMLDGIVRDVLAFSREGTMRWTRVTAREVMEQALASCAGVLSESVARVEACEMEGCMLEGDGGLLAQALGNVIRNAAEAVKLAHAEDEKRVIRVGAERRKMRRPGGASEGHVVMWVEDSGRGVPEAIRQRIFSPFFTTRAQGTGLGLAIVHRIVDAHGGQVAVTEGRCGGARFELCVPTGTREQASAGVKAGACEGEEEGGREVMIDVMRGGANRRTLI